MSPRGPQEFSPITETINQNRHRMEHRILRTNQSTFLFAAIFCKRPFADDAKLAFGNCDKFDEETPTAAALFDSRIESKISFRKIEILRGALMPNLTDSPSIFVILISISSPINIDSSALRDNISIRRPYLEYIRKGIKHC